MICGIDRSAISSRATVAIRSTVDVDIGGDNINDRMMFMRVPAGGIYGGQQTDARWWIPWF